MPSWRRAFPIRPQRAAEVARLAREWAEAFDPMSLVSLMRAAEGFDVRPQLPAIAGSGTRCCTCCRAPTRCSRPRSRAR
jgi:hypothetical protein